MTRLRKFNSVAFATLIRCLLQGPCTTHDLAEATGLSLCTCRSYLAEFHQQGVVHVVEWCEDARHTPQVRAYAIGLDKKDKPRPPLKDPNIRAKLYKRRRRMLAKPGLSRLGVVTT